LSIDKTSLAAGELNRRLILLRKVTADEDTSLAPIDTVWAKVQPLRADEAYRFGHLGTSISHKITIRYRSDSDFAKLTHMQLEGTGRIFRLVGKPYCPDEGQRVLVITAMEVTEDKA